MASMQQQQQMMMMQQQQMTMMMMQQHQQQQQQQPSSPSHPPPSITSEQIQKYLEDNKKLILAILDNQNLGKLSECAQYQALLQKNLMYLAAIADSQPQAPAMPAQMTTPPNPAMQQGGSYVAHPQAASLTQQAGRGGLFPQPKGMPLQQQLFSSPQQMQEHQQQLLHQYQVMQGHLRPSQIEANGGGGSSKQNDTSAAGHGGGDEA